MKKIVVLAISLLFVGSAAFAQEPTQARTIPQQREGAQVRQQKTPEQRAEQMKKDYNLTEEQTAELTAYFKRQQEQRAEMMKKAQNAREEMGKVQDVNEKELQKILGEENYKKFTEQRAARIKESRGHFQMNDSTMRKQRFDGHKAKQTDGAKPQRKKAPAKVKTVEKTPEKAAKAK